MRSPDSTGSVIPQKIPHLLLICVSVFIPKPAATPAPPQFLTPPSPPPPFSVTVSFLCIAMCHLVCTHVWTTLCLPVCLRLYSTELDPDSFLPIPQTLSVLGSGVAMFSGQMDSLSRTFPSGVLKFHRGSELCFVAFLHLFGSECAFLLSSFTFWLLILLDLSETVAIHLVLLLF